jgi:hypothetical protein
MADKTTHVDETHDSSGAAAALLSCFVVAPIGSEGSATRKRSNQVLRHVIDPVIAELGYAPALRSDNMADSGLITRQVIDQVMNADLVVADLTDSNPNVFYELALRHAFRKPFVQIIVGTSMPPLPFDVADQRTIFFDHTDLDSVERAKAALHEHVEATMQPDAVVESPVSFTVDLSALRSSPEPAERGQADIMEMIEDLRRIVLRSNHEGLQGPAKEDVRALRALVLRMSSRGLLSEQDHLGLMNPATSSEHNDWVRALTKMVRGRSAVAALSEDLMEKTPMEVLVERNRAKKEGVREARRRATDGVFMAE